MDRQPGSLELPLRSGRELLSLTLLGLRPQMGKEGTS